jgi:hypothetical protein
VPPDIASRNKKAGILGIVAGILLLIAGVNGAAFWASLSATLETVLPDNDFSQVVLIILLVLTFIAALGGIAVMIGSVMIMKTKVGLGKFIVGLGAGTGLIGLIIAIVLPLWQGGLAELLFVMLGLLTFQGIGVILSIVARMMAKKPDKK